MTIYWLELYSMRLSDTTREAQNPFTGEPITIHVDDGFSRAEQLKIERRLVDLGGRRVDEDGYREVRLKSGAVARFRDFGFPGLHPLPTLAIEYEKVDPEFCELLLELSREAFGAVRVGVNCVAVPDNKSFELAEKRWTQVSRVDGAAELEAWLDSNKSNVD